MHTMLKNVVYSLTYIMFYLFKQPCQPQWHVLVTTMALQMKAKYADVKYQEIQVTEFK